MIGIKIWDIVDAKVVFNEDDNQFKIRPVLVLDEINNIYCSFKITSNTTREGLGEYTVVEWKKAGLDKESNIRLNRMFMLSPNNILSKRGVLELKDREQFIKAMKDFYLVYNSNYTPNLIKKIEKRIKQNLPDDEK